MIVIDHMKFLSNRVLDYKKIKNVEEKILICIKCGHNIINEVSNTITTNNKPNSVSNYGYSESTLKIMDVEKPIESLPTTNIECPKCYNNLAFWWMLQTISADEATTQFYRCT